MRRTSSLRIILLGYVVRGPLAGLAWHHLQYVLGLTRLGHDVYYMEDSDDYASCYNPESNVQGTDPKYGMQFLSSALSHLGLQERWAYYDAHTTQWLGPCAGQVPSICATADLCINLSAVNPLRPWLMQVPVRVLLDTDPAFTQVRHLTSVGAFERATRHNVFCSFGENLPTGRSTIPDDGLPWQATRQPIVLDAWPVTPGPADGPFTSVLLWEAYPRLEYAGQRYGSKGDSFLPLLDLPAATGPVFQLAFGSRTEPGRLMQDHGWYVIDPREPTRTLARYERFIQTSKAEFSVAKHGYVVSRSGWFSERSAAYLASGRPVIAQDTGFGEWMRVGDGVVAFADKQQALEAIDEINSRYRRHCTAAREVVHAYFAAEDVLTRLVDRVMIPVRTLPSSSGAHLNKESPADRQRH